MRLALAAWAVPLTALLYWGTVEVLDRAVPWPEAVCVPTGEDPYEEHEQCEPGESKSRDVVNVLSAEKVTAPVLALGLLGGLGLAVAALVRTRGDVTQRAARRVALAALIALVAVPAVVGGFLLFVIASFRIAG